MTQYARSTDADGVAALGICESMLLALTDLKIISDKDARDLLTDVATTHTEAANQSANRRAIRPSLGLCSASSRQERRAATDCSRR